MQGLKSSILAIFQKSADWLDWTWGTIAFHCSEMASLSNWTSGQSKNLKKESKLLTRAFQITYFILILINRWIRFKKNHLRAIFGF